MRTKGLRGLAAPSGPVPPAGGTGSPAEGAVDGGRAGDVSSQRPWPTSCGTGSSTEVAVGAYGGPAGMAVPNCTGPPARGTGSPARVAVGAYGGCLQGAVVCPPIRATGSRAQRRSVPNMRLRGLVVPSGPGPLAARALHTHLPPLGQDSLSAQQVVPARWDVPSSACRP